MRRLLLTGSGGFVARHLRPLLEAAYPLAEIVGAARPADDPTAEPFDLLDVAGIAALVATVRPDACIHLAAVTTVPESLADPDLAWRANVDGTRALAAAILRYAPACHLLHVSSGEVYGLSFRAGRELDETAPMRPANPYAAAKAAIDLALGEMAWRGLRVVRLRPLNHVGPGQSTRFAVAAFAAQIARIEAGLQAPVIHTGPLDRARDFLDVRDVCAAYVAALRHAPALPAGAVFNVASGRPRSMATVLQDLLAVGGVAARIAPDPTAARPIDLPSTSCSAAAARAALGWVPRIPWRQTLQDVLAAQRESLAATTMSVGVA